MLKTSSKGVQKLPWQSDSANTLGVVQDIWVRMFQQEVWAPALGNSREWSYETHMDSANIHR